MSLILAACGKHAASRTTPSDPFTKIAVSSLSISPLAGTNVLILTVGTLVVGDSANQLPELEATKGHLLALANAALDTALRRDGREVDWLGIEDQRRAARRNPTLAIEPDHFATQYLFDPRVDRIPDPLWAQLRSLAAVSNARYVVVPAGVKISGAPGALVASYVVVLADARSGGVLTRVRAQGHPAATPEAAFAIAAGTLIVSPVH